MEPHEILTALDAAGIEVITEPGGRMALSKPPTALPEEVVAAIQADPDGLRSAYLEREWLRYLESRPLPTDDPRPDLAEDSERWTALLNLANAQDTALRQTLHGFRCLGARLVMEPEGLRLVPGEMDPAEYARYREEWLIPRAAEAAEVLATLGERLARHARLKVPQGQRVGVGRVHAEVAS